MAVDKYVDDLVAADKLVTAAKVNGAKKVVMLNMEEIAADGNGSVYRFFKSVSPDLIIISLKVYCDAAITLAIDSDIGVYETNLGAVIDADIFADSLDLAVAGGALQGTIGGATETPADGLCSVDIANRLKMIYEHAGHTISNRKAGYDICLTTNTDAGTGGTVLMILEGVQGG